MEENDFVSIWLEESGNPAIEELTNKNLEVAHQTSNLLAEKNLLANDFARIVDINPDEISRWFMGKHSFSIKKLKEITEAFNTYFSAN
ncbi:helix-turn-helix transcriptional regulator [Pedobacter agri]|uniref:Helix-turn-helix transcriptional regulator n=2 Tax=Pedobacter agri TaxID=454586 RepID=A0A9X3DFK4_9SPHI|nr:helix-turn-helix transcriptional regulator [Pedobacter agri]MCX3266332.1 helix-turn-helix transcriptional regulator [Pedobacter agri]